MPEMFYGESPPAYPRSSCSEGLLFLLPMWPCLWSLSEGPQQHSPRNTPFLHSPLLRPGLGQVSTGSLVAPGISQSSAYFCLPGTVFTGSWPCLGFALPFFARAFLKQQRSTELPCCPLILAAAPLSSALGHRLPCV